MKELSLKPRNKAMGVSSLAKGLYFIVLTNGDNERLVGKIIKE
jgi:hypothetical protein